MKRICVFCGSSKGVRSAYAAAAKALGQVFVRRNISLVYGGSDIGLMGVIADTMLAEGGKVIGVIPQGLVAKEVAHQHLTEQHIVNTMHERKALMAELSDAFIAMPGGMGTFDEFCEILTWAQLGIHQKPCGILNVENYFTPLLAMFDHAMNEGFLRDTHRALVLEASEPEALLRKLETYQPQYAEKWLDLDKV
ncbi:MAG TPA: TIGR00730 family Rossman fold protein [Blastocatellia bacterium]|nr:TIGR00730 family Rossman fold protein [Blastocatellia bacterium]